jgi:hypothetical protein
VGLVDEKVKILFCEDVDFGGGFGVVMFIEAAFVSFVAVVFDVF